MSGFYICYQLILSIDGWTIMNKWSKNVASTETPTKSGIEYNESGSNGIDRSNEWW